MAERFFAELVGLENASTHMTDLVSNQGVVQSTITATPVSAKHLVFTFLNDIPVVSTDGTPTVSFEYDTTEPTWSTGYVTVTDGDHASGYTMVIDTSEVDMGTVGTFDVTWTATDASGNVSDPHSIEMTIVDTTIPVITLTSATDDVEASDVATWEALTNMASAIDGHDGDVSGSVVLGYFQDTVGGADLTDLAGARTHLGTLTNVVAVAYNVDDASSNSAVQKVYTVTAIADA